MVIGFGRSGSVTLLARPPLQSRFDDGLGKPGGVSITLDPEFGLRFDPGNTTFPAIDDYVVDSGGGGTVTLASPCNDDPSLTSCGGGVLYNTGGKFVPVGSVVFKDGSQLCDKMTVSVLTAPLQVKLDVSITPRRRQYVPGDPARGSAHVRVRLRNTSPPAPLNNILILGNALTCDSEVRVGSTTITKTTEIDLQHCSATVHQPCNSDADCGTPPRYLCRWWRNNGQAHRPTLRRASFLVMVPMERCPLTRPSLSVFVSPWGFPMAYTFAPTGGRSIPPNSSG